MALNSNPWNFDTIEDLLFYCCPECDMKTKESQDIINHAFQIHRKTIPMQKETQNVIKAELNTEELISDCEDNFVDSSDEQDVFLCFLCEKVSTSEIELSEHMTKEHSETNLKS